MASLIRIGVVFSFLIVTIQAEQMLAFAPVTALARWEGFNRRQLYGDCPAASQTLCPDHLGCCPRGAACTYSRDIPVCDESCNGGPSCPRGGCCQLGYVCGITNNFCTPAPTPHPKQTDHKQVEAPATITGSASVVDPGELPLKHIPSTIPTDGAVDSVPATLTTTASTTTTPLQAAHEPLHYPESTTSKASTPIVGIYSSHRVVPATATASTATARDGSNFVSKASGSETKSSSPSTQATSSGAGFLLVSGTNGFLVGMILGWLVSYCVLI